MIFNNTTIQGVAHSHSDFLSCFLVQILCLAEQIQFTEDVERALKEQNLQQLAIELNAKLEHYTSVDTSAKDPADTGGTCQARI